MSNTQVKLHVGETLEAVGARATNAWHRMERGEAVDEKHVSYENRETLVRVLSPKRFELLRHLHQHPAKTIRALALSLGRDYRRVHEDVEALASAGLLDRDKDGLRVEYDAFDVQMRVACNPSSPSVGRPDRRLAAPSTNRGLLGSRHHPGFPAPVTGEEPAEAGLELPAWCAYSPIYGQYTAPIERAAGMG